MDIELLINTMNVNEIATFIKENNKDNDNENNKNSNVDNCNSNDDVYSQKSSEYNDANDEQCGNNDNDCKCNCECNCESGDDCCCYEDEDEDDDENNNYGKRTLIYYYEEDDMHDEELNYNYHIKKNFGNWQYAKMIVSHSYNDKLATEFFWDYLETQFNANNDSFDNIIKVYYKNDLDLGIIYEFDNQIAKYLVDNLKIQSYKLKGYIFNGDENINKWSFKIVVITSKGIYTANRYISENIIGFY